jgi:hypothetical protein
MGDHRPVPRHAHLRLPTPDPASRRTLAYLALKLCVILGFATIGAALDPHPAPRFCAVVQVLAFLVGVLATANACRSGQTPRDRAFDQWDEALAFAALGLLAKIGVRLLGG